MFLGKRPLNIKCIDDNFSMKRALLLAKASGLSYGDYEYVKRVCGRELGVNKNDVFFAAYGTTQVYVFSKPGEVIVAFRGTEMSKISDWIADLDAVTGKTNIGEAHKGFLEGYKLVAGDIVAKIMPAITGKKRVYICGHSLGGALALMCSVELYCLGVLISGVYTYGQPRIGKSRMRINFPKDLENRVYRFANDKDIVPRVPPRLMGYRHVGSLRFFTDDGMLHFDNTEWRKYKRQCRQNARSVVGRLLELVANSGEMFADHNMDDYIRLIEEAA